MHVQVAYVYNVSIARRSYVGNDCPYAASARARTRGPSYSALPKAQRGNARDRRHHRTRQQRASNRRSIAMRRDLRVVHRSQTDVDTTHTSRAMSAPYCDACMAATRVAAPHARTRHAPNRFEKAARAIRRDLRLQLATTRTSTTAASASSRAR